MVVSTFLESVQRSFCRSHFVDVHTRRVCLNGIFELPIKWATQVVEPPLLELIVVSANKFSVFYYLVVLSYKLKFALFDIALDLVCPGLQLVQLM